MKNNIEMIQEKNWKNYGEIYAQKTYREFVAPLNYDSDYLQSEQFKEKENFFNENSACGLIAGCNLDFSFMGCELIAVYNACVGINMPMPIQYITYWFEQNNGLILSGLFGTNPYKFKDFFDTHHIKYKMYEDISEVPETNAEGRNCVYIISIWNSHKTVKEGVHTFAVFANGTELKSLNHINYTPNDKVTKTKISDFIDEEKFICVYEIEEKELNGQ